MNKIGRIFFGIRVIFSSGLYFLFLAFLINYNKYYFDFRCKYQFPTLGLKNYVSLQSLIYTIKTLKKPIKDYFQIFAVYMTIFTNHNLMYFKILIFTLQILQGVLCTQVGLADYYAMTNSQFSLQGVVRRGKHIGTDD